MRFYLRSWFGVRCLPRSPCSAARLSVLVHHVLPDALYAGDRHTGKASHTHTQTPRASVPLITSRCSTQFGNMEGITTAVLDEFPQLRVNTLHKSLFLAALCFCFYLMGLLLVTDVSVFKVRVSVEHACSGHASPSRLCTHRVGFTGSLSLTPSALALASSSSLSSCALASPSSMVFTFTPPLSVTDNSSNLFTPHCFIEKPNSRVFYIYVDVGLWLDAF